MPMPNNRPYCEVCNDDLVHVSDGNAGVWFVHAHMRNDDHKVIPTYEQDVPWTMVDMWLGILVLLGSVTWFLTR